MDQHSSLFDEEKTFFIWLTEKYINEANTCKLVDQNLHVGQSNVTSLSIQSCMLTDQDLQIWRLDNLNLKVAGTKLIIWPIKLASWSNKTYKLANVNL